MKKLYFLNEEESDRILNLHKDATKKQYLTENNKKLITEGTGTKDDPFTDADLTPDVNTLVNAMDGWVDGEDITEVYGVITKYLTSFAINDDDLSATTVEPAIKRITTLYSLDENGDSLVNDITGVGTTTLDNATIKRKNQIVQMINKGLATVTPVASSGTTSGTTDTSEMEKWKNFPCVPKHPKAKQEKLSDSSFTYSIDGIYYYSNGRKQLTDGTTVNYTCNDPEFKPTRSGSTVKQLTTPSDAELDAVLGKL